MVNEQNGYAELDFAFAIGKLMRRIRHRMDAALVPYGISHQQARVLMMLAGHRSSEPSMYQKDMEHALDLRGASVTSLLKGLENKGLIERRAGALDGRKKSPTLTRSGQELCGTLPVLFREVNGQIVQGMDAHQCQTLRHLLTSALENLEEGR